MSRPRDKSTSLSTAADLLLSPEPDSTPSPPPPPIYSIALTLDASSSSAEAEVPPSLLAPLEAQVGPSAKGSYADRVKGFKDDAGSYSRFGPISVEGIDFQGPDVAERDAGEGPPASQEARIELPFGTVHLYRHSDQAAAAASSSSNYVVASVQISPSPSTSESTSSSLSLSPKSRRPPTIRSTSSSTITPSSSSQTDRPPPPPEPVWDGKLCAVLAVPAYYSPSDLLHFIGRAEADVESLRMIRDASPSRSVVLIRFRSREGAEDFIDEFNGKPFNVFEPETCHVVRILSVLQHSSQPPSSSAGVESVATGGEPAPTSIQPFPYTPESEKTRLAAELEDAVELPTCCVCLERLDSSVSGLVTIPCSHSFHCKCLIKWGNSRCPVCRYSQTPVHFNNPPSGPPVPASTVGLSTCSACATTDSLWCCIICGSLGCGRYSEGKHAKQHYELTGHAYALELETQRVWNYIADEYVHRLLLLQGKSSSSPAGFVELPSSTSTSSLASQALAPNSSSAVASAPAPSEKLEAISLEYSHLLTSQLSAQRSYYLAEQESLESRVAELESLLLAREQVEAQRKVDGTDKERLRKAEKDLRGEREMSRGLIERLRETKARVEEGEKEIGRLKAVVGDKEDEVRDLMFFLEAREKIGEAEAAGEREAGRESTLLEELQGGSIVVPAVPPRTASPARAGGSKKKKGAKK